MIFSIQLVGWIEVSVHPNVLSFLLSVSSTDIDLGELPQTCEPRDHDRLC